MALSKRKTPVAILRGLLGPFYGKEEHFAVLVSRSRSWVKKTSAGLEPLTVEMALRIEAETGISPTWLLTDKPEAPPVSNAGMPYDIKAFEMHREQVKKGSFTNVKMMFLAGALPEIAGIGAAAGQKGMISLFNRQWLKFLHECRKEFGFDEAAMNKIRSELEKTNLPNYAVHDSSIDAETGVISTLTDASQYLEEVAVGVPKKGKSKSGEPTLAIHLR